MNWLQRMHGLGVRPLRVGLHEVLDDPLLEHLAEVEHVVRDVELSATRRASSTAPRAQHASSRWMSRHLGQSGQTLSVTPITS